MLLIQICKSKRSELINDSDRCNHEHLDMKEQKMNRKLYSILTVVAVSFALVLGFGAFNVVKAVPGTSGERVIVPGAGVDQFGIDAAANRVETMNRDRELGNFRFSPDTYGLHGTLRP